MNIVKGLKIKAAYDNNNEGRAINWQKGDEFVVYRVDESHNSVILAAVKPKKMHDISLTKERIEKSFKIFHEGKGEKND